MASLAGQDCPTNLYLVPRRVCEHSDRSARSLRSRRQHRALARAAALSITGREILNGCDCRHEPKFSQGRRAPSWERVEHLLSWMSDRCTGPPPPAMGISAYCSRRDRYVTLVNDWKEPIIGLRAVSVKIDVAWRIMRRTPVQRLRRALDSEGR
jgi:hypothetical protein